ncbi:MASE1 domain-containing protein [Anabaena sp. FACHB-709]|uniref:histidine kinase n=2 Tax=Nostocaceae TaxID=1162 RepID=A0A1Z4KJ00_ANAVA|nr:MULTISPECIES: MASE1 domain-containing protein [Nostocaceae]BAY68904.1 two-component hybrid sensor and regulator [Trichormus variabilis NIES-23]HBW31587.1 PAS domain S-box protein [Nostoc sp. UBA8866]MBD2170478.1 MASE1 domain-containing protein [Anabaena cylindrica FACHB-318]MBD2262046.1 MASE1 domain-containing protein [Anabaena sp. FACHB-709]MBD2271810.1 MASE1 domain-containing protein [Nostoc sp. PCC 7120 = FACHB-418]
MTDSMKIAIMRRWLMISLLGLFALVIAHGMALIYRIQPGVSLWFPPSGVAIALTFWFGPCGIILTGLASFLMSPFWGLHGWERLIALVDIIEPLSAWLLYRRLWKGSRTINTLKDATLFTVSAPLVACATLAIIGSVCLVAIGKMPLASLSSNIPHWWLGNAIGVMAIAPTALLVFTPYFQSQGWLHPTESLNSGFVSQNFHPSRCLLLEFSAILLLCLAIATLTVAETNQNGFKLQQLSFLGFVPVLWAATRFGVTSGMLTSSFCVLVTLFAYLVAYPKAMYLATFPVQAEVLHVHKLSLLVQCAVSLFVGIAITERSSIQVELAVEKVRRGEYQTRAELSEKLIQLNESLVAINDCLEESHREKDELLQREQALRSRLSNILSSMTDAFIAVNRDWDITYCNHQAAKIQDLEPEDLIGKNYWEQWTRTKGTDFEREYRRSLAENIPVHFEILYELWDMWLEVHAYPSEDGLGIFFRNITERKQAEQEREYLLMREQIARGEAERANRLKDDFLAVLSHELRTPLNPILGWATLLKKRNLEEATRRRGIETIERNAKLQIQLIEDLLDVSRIQQGKLSLNIQSVNLVHTIEEALETVRLAIEAKSIHIKTALGVNVGMVAGDAARLQQIIWNLLANAIKFTPPAGQIQVVLERVNNSAQIQIQDNGKGISSEFLPYVFEYFRQADGTITRQFGGLGLGLAIVKHLTELHGGTVKAESAGEGMGAIFTVNLPLMLNAPQKVPQVGQPDNTWSLGGLYILVVDDDVDTGEFLTLMLEQSGAEVTAVTSAGEALEVIARTKVDLLLSDIGMPGIDGYMLMQLIRAMPSAKGGKIPAIALTAYAGEINQKQALAAGFQLHLVKPVEAEKLLQGISEVLAASPPEFSYVSVEN